VSAAIGDVVVVDESVGERDLTAEACGQHPVR
jgi:hypothetical protein